MGEIWEEDGRLCQPQEIHIEMSQGRPGPCEYMPY